MKYVFSSLVALGLVASALGLATAQAADRPWVACWAKKFAVEGGSEVVLSWAKRRHYISPATAHWAHAAQLMRNYHDTASCARE
jgi:hypothetical protein